MEGMKYKKQHQTKFQINMAEWDECYFIDYY